ncbi:MAG: CHAT domain-containing tetratricopeptide repeat protein [Saprospiraceae bacterium]
MHYTKTGNYLTALKIYNFAISHFNEFQVNSKHFAYALKNASQIQERFLNYPAAINYNLLAIKKDSTNAHLASIYNNLISNYNSINQYSKAIEYFEKAKKLNQSAKKKIILKENISDAYFQTGDYEKVIQFAFENIDLMKANKKFGYTPWIEYKNLAEVFSLQNKTSESRHFFLEAIAAAKKEYVSKNREIAKIETAVGEFYLAQNNIDSALSHYQQALIQVFPNFNSTNIADNPSINDIYTESWIMTASARKAEALRARYDHNKDIADLKNAAECFDLSLAGIKALADSYGTDNAKLYLGDYSHNYFEEAIEINYLLFQATKDHQYLEKIFSIMERSKANVLTEAIQKNRGLILAGIPDSLLGLEQNLRLELADLNKSIKMEELYESEADTERISDLRSRMTSQQRAYEQLLAKLKIDYPQFNSYIEEPATPTIAEVQHYLRERGETMLEYFEGGKHIYLIQITGSGSSIQQIPHSDFWDDQIGDYQDYFRNSNAIINDPTGYFSVAESLYRQVFPFDSLDDKLVIIPDGVLNFIPFEALLKEQPSEIVFSAADFLLLQHQIRFAYSAGLLMSPSMTAKPNKNLLRISPLFANRERGLAPLLTGNEPIASIPQLQTLQGSAATLAAFREQAAHCQLLQLSTHAGADENDFAPRIEFIDQPLYLPELYAMKIPAELVVLSACETGLGKFEKGEGVMSLARGFAYAGANDLVASLWKVNESSTSDLMQYFYANIKTGQTKSAALREAKLQYLREAKSDAKLSPYYWAGFVSIGHDLPMDLNRISIPWWALLSIAALIFVFIFWKYKNQ